MEAAVLDLHQLRDVCMEDQELMREMVLALIDDAKKHLPVIEQAVERADAQRCARLAHYVRGACANVGAVSMAVILKTIERHATAGDFPACRAALSSLEAELEKFSSEAASL